MENEEEKLPEEKMPEIIRQILQDYGLKEKQEQILSEWSESKDIKKSKELFCSLPASIISETLGEYHEGLIDEKELSSFLAKDLKIEQEKANEIAEKLLNEVTPLLEMLPPVPKAPTPLKKKAEREGEEKEERKTGRDPYLEGF